MKRDDVYEAVCELGGKATSRQVADMFNANTSTISNHLRKLWMEGRLKRHLLDTTGPNYEYRVRTH